MKKLKTYRLSKDTEVYYIKKFVNGVTKEEFEYLFMSGLMKALVQVSIGQLMMEETLKAIKILNPIKNKQK